MQITKMLRVNGSSEINGALLTDMDQTYPVFLESLHNGVYLNGLLESGYKLTGLPYNFVLNGMSIYELPTEDFTADDDVLADMYNYVGAPLPYDEIKSKMTVEEIQTRKTPPTNYTINTRKELLDYLDTCAQVDLPEDFKPLNYFVAPSARFSIEEYTSDVYAKYVEIISERRHMSLQKYYALFAWLTQFGMSPNAQPIDVVEAYFAWGIDGLDIPIINSRREMREAELTAGQQAIPVYRQTIGFIDSKGNMLTAPNEEKLRWEAGSGNPNYVSEVAANLTPGDSMVCCFQCRARQQVIVLESPQFNITLSQDRLIMLRKQYPTFIVSSPIVSSSLPLGLTSPAKKHDLFEWCYMEALAAMLYDKRRCRAKVSSYKALSICGTNPSTALNYIATMDEMDKGSDDEDQFKVMDYDIRDFLSGDKVKEEVAEYILGVIEGNINIDNVGKAREAEAHVSTGAIFNEIYAIHNVMGISLNDIYDKFQTIDENSTALVFSNGEFSHSIEVSPMKMRLNGYLSDIQSYDLKCAEKCTVFNYIINAAREVGVNECDRHVGIEFFSVIVKPAVRDILGSIEAFYTEQVNMRIADVKERNQLLALRHMFKLSRYYEIALNGTCTLPDKLGGQVLRATSEQSALLMKYVERKIENIVTYCSYTVGGSSFRDMVIDMYCVNAYVTPERVIPRKGYKIHEAAFYALWNNYSRTAPELYAQLVGTGVIPQGFVSWSCRYYDEQYVKRDMFNTEEINDLIYYNKNSVQEQNAFPDDEEFHNTPHPIEYMFPGLHTDDTQNEKLSVPRQGGVTVRLGYHRELTLDDMKQYLYPEEIEEEPEQYLRRFSSLSAEGFYLCKDILDKIPEKSKDAVVVAANEEHIYLPNEGKTIDFRDLPQYASEYNVAHMYDRIYVFAALDGSLWEARI